MAGTNIHAHENSSSLCGEEHDSNESSESESEREEDEIYPSIEPVYDGKKLDIDAKLVENGFSAISYRHLHRRLPQGLKFSQGTIQERNSFYNIHRPDLKNLNWARKIPEECHKDAIEEKFLEFAKDNLKVNDHSTELRQRLSSTSEYNSSQSSTDSSKTTLKESRKEASNSVNHENSHLLLIMAPVQMESHSDESVIWAMNDLREACPLESQEKRTGRDTGGGEEGEFEDKNKLCHTAFGSSAGPTECS